MAKYPAIVDGQDFTDLFHKYGYEVTYEFREGENGFLMCSGDELRGIAMAFPPRIAQANNICATVAPYSPKNLSASPASWNRSSPIWRLIS